MKKALIIAIIVVGVIALVMVAFFWKFKQETKKMNPLDTAEVIPDVFAVKTNYVNFFLLKNDKGYIAIDAGENLKVAERELETLGINATEIHTVLLTHAHNDHIAALKLFENADIYIHENEKIADNNYKLVKDGDKIILDNVEVECLSTNGHTDGSVSYLVNGKHLFVGDTLSLKEGTAQVFNEFFNQDTEKQKEVLSKMAQMQGIEYIFTAHYGYSDDFEKTFGGWK